MKKLFILAILCIVHNMLFAQRLSETEALTIAYQFFDRGDTQLSVVNNNDFRKYLRVRNINTTDSTALSGFYIINDVNNNRFVIVAADKRMNKILGYSNSGMFSTNCMPDGLLEILDGYNQQYSFLLRNTPNDQLSHSALTTDNAQVWSQQIVPISPLVLSEWGQDRPFNNQCPLNPRYSVDSLCASGCVATAMAQVLNYYNYPITGNGIYSYRSATLNIPQTFDFSSLNMQWDSLCNRYNASASISQQNEVAKLIHACGVSVSMDYGSTGNSSGAYDCDIPYALIYHFGYNPNVVYRNRQYYSNDEWHNIILSELQSNRPILYSGRGNGGHQYILDGYNEQGLFHFNFGWTISIGAISLTGIGNGYYSLDAINPTFLGESLGNYSLNQAMICHISPTIVGNKEDVFYATNFSISSTSNVRIGGRTYVSCFPKCYSSETTYTGHSSAMFSGEVGVGVFDTAFNFISALTSKQVTCRSLKTIVLSDNITLSASVFKNGEQYFIAPYAKSNNSTSPTLIRTENGATDYYLATVLNDQINFIVKGKPSHSELSHDERIAIPEGPYKVSATTDNLEMVEWRIDLVRDAIDSTKYWFYDWDSIAKSNGYSYANGWNKVYGFLSNFGTQLTIPVGQMIGNGLYIHNFSGSNNITVQLSISDSTMMINDVWGTVRRDMNSENPSQVEISRYTATRYKYMQFNAEEDVNAPLIRVINNYAVIDSYTDSASVFYTLNGSTPNRSSYLYTDTIVLRGNCTIKAIAYKGNNSSPVTQYVVNTFIVTPPIISESNDTIRISCATAGAVIHYTTDGSQPNRSSAIYSNEFTVNNSAVIKAFSMKANYKDSEITTYIHQDTTTTDNLVINNLVAGDLENRIQSISTSFNGLTITGNLNGTDLAYIRLLINNKNLTDLDIRNCRIVRGGNAYYSSYSSSYYTKQDTISEYMFYDCKKLISLSLPNNCSVIESNAIYRCENLYTIQIPASCKKIDMWGISYCPNLSGLHLPASLKLFAPNNLRECPNLRMLTIDSSNQTYRAINNTLYSYNLDTLVKYLPGNTNHRDSCISNVKVIGQYALRDAQFNEFVLPNNLKEIETSAFEDCKNLISITIPNSVEKIGLCGFCNCSALKTVILSDNLRKLETLVFGYCLSLETIHITPYISNIEGTAFSNCSSLQTFTVSEDNQTFCSIGGVLYSKNGEKLIRCPLALFDELFYVQEGTKEIAYDAFSKCTHIKSFYLPESLEKIGMSAFEDCTMKYIRIPTSVTSIGSMAFHNCDSLESLAIPSNVTKLELLLGAYNQKLSYVQIPANVSTIGLSVFAECPSLNMIHSKIDNLSAVEFKESYSGEVEAFKNISDTCVWRIPYGTSSQYRSQTWWISTWRIVEDISLDNIDVYKNCDIKISSTKGQLTIYTTKEMHTPIYMVNGTLYSIIDTSENEEVTISLPSGIYIINGDKYIVSY